MHALHLLNKLPWPLHGGRQINAHHLMRSLVERGHRVSLLLSEPPSDEVVAAWPLSSQVTIHVLDQRGTGAPRREDACRWKQYWGVPPWAPRAVALLCERLSPDYVEAIGLDTPLWLAALPRGTRRLWLAGDSPSLLHRTLIGSAPGVRRKMDELRRMLVMAAYEKQVAPLVDAAAVVSPADAEALRRRGGFGEILLTPNGVDADFYQPGTVQPDAHSAVFWGGLDFPPNVDAITSFIRDVWPTVLRKCPQAKLRVVGRLPVASVTGACTAPGVELIRNVPDVRPWIARGAVAVMPMRSGAGIKNKLLEAAAMARPILASPRAVAGLIPPADAPAWRICCDADQWAQALVDLWEDPAAGRRLGQAAHRWVTAHHRWPSHAMVREQWLKRMGGHNHLRSFVNPVESRAA